MFAWDSMAARGAWTTHELNRPGGVMDGFTSLFQLRVESDERPDLAEWVMTDPQWTALRARTRLRAVPAFYACEQASEWLSARLFREEQEQAMQSGQPSPEQVTRYQRALEREQKAMLALQQAVTEGEMLEQLMHGAGRGDQPATPRAVRRGELTEQARRILQVAARLMGRMHGERHDRRAEEFGVGDAGYQFGIDIERADPLEFVLPGWQARYQQGKLLCYEPPRVQREQEGDLVLLVDESGSMDGDRIVLAKASALALMHAKRQRRRQVQLMRFSTEVHPTDLTDPRSLESFLNTMLGGGTNFDKALHAASDAIRTLRKADVVLITDADGYQESPEPFQQARHQHGARLWVVRCESTLEVPDADGIYDLTESSIVHLDSHMAGEVKP